MSHREKIFPTHGRGHICTEFYLPRQVRSVRAPDALLPYTVGPEKVSNAKMMEERKAKSLTGVSSVLLILADLLYIYNWLSHQKL
jgi:hypothetical protein